ncbi:MAG TPA: OmpA family protein [Nitrospira sp.]|nr:OmpA family protein [Nitrospira sp.]
MIIKLSALALVSIAMLCEAVPVSIAVVQPMAMNSSVELRSDRSQKEATPFSVSFYGSISGRRLEPSGSDVAQIYRVYDDRRDRGDSDARSPQDELSVMRNSLQQAKQKIDELERQLASDNLENAKRRIGELILQLHAKENEISALRSSVHENSKRLREDLASQTEELNQAKRRVAEVEQQMTAGKGQELTQAKRRAAEAEQQTARKEQELAQIKRRVTEVEQQMAAGKDQELAQAKRRAAEAEQQTARKEQELAQAKRRAAEVEQQMAGKEQELAQAKRRMTEAEQLPAVGKEQELAQAKRRAAEAEQQTARKEQELAQARDDLKQVTQKLADLSPQLMAKDAELARMKQLLENLERNPSTPAEATPSQEESLPEKNSPPPQSVEENLSASNLLPPPAVADDPEVLLSSDLGKISESLASLLQPELKKGNVTLRQRGNKLTLAFSAGELFTSGDATVTLGGTSLLERVGTLLHGFRYQSVEVAAHTDNTPVRNDSRRGFRDNIELSRTRAEHASQALVNGGLDADRVKAVGYADTKPIATNETEKGRSKNRRMEIVITQWLETGANSSDAKAQVGKKLRGFSTQAVTHH